MGLLSSVQTNNWGSQKNPLNRLTEMGPFEHPQHMFWVRNMKINLE